MVTILKKLSTNLFIKIKKLSITLKLRKYIYCPKCQIQIELEKDNYIKRKFNCPGCEILIDLDQL